MPKKKKSLGDQSIDKNADELARGAAKAMYKDGKLTTQGRALRS